MLVILCLLSGSVALKAKQTVVSAAGFTSVRPLSRAPVLLQARASLKPKVHTSQERPLSFLQEDADEFLTEVLPMAAPVPPKFVSQDRRPATPETADVVTEAAGPAGPLSVAAPREGKVDSPPWGLLPWQLLLIGAGVCTAGVLFSHRRDRDRVTQEVEKVPVSLSSDLETLPVDEPRLVRLEGLLGAESKLAAPFSEKPCVFFSASVCRHRPDGMGLPVAFHSQQAAFHLKLQDAPDVVVHIDGDVALFDMQSGREEWRQAFCEAPKPWCSFVLNHLVQSPDAAAHFKQSLELGSGAQLDFRESALRVSSAESYATCVGQVTRASDGRLSLQPWQPPRRAKPFWRRLAPVDCLVGSVLISDNPALCG
ncbi:unnamed protein product [Effrenium voratum]|nr:unnamed protein product [Effrenium voratum]